MSTESEVRRFDSYLSKIMPEYTPIYGFQDKEKCINNKVVYMLSRTQSMFKYEGLPDTMPRRTVELFEQINGFGGVCPHGKENYFFFGSLGGVPDYNYMPTEYVVANPALHLSRRYKINEECVVIPNDSMYRGLLPIFRKYATLETEAELSLWIATVNTRVSSVLSADNDTTRESAKKYIEDLWDGRLGIIADIPFLEGIKVQPYAERNYTVITNLIEAIQYNKASCFNEIGLNANYNMKRESLNTTESQMNNDALLPLVDDMLRQRQEGWDKANQLLGLKVKVDFDSSWYRNIEEMDAELKALQNTTLHSSVNEGGDESEKEDKTRGTSEEE